MHFGVNIAKVDAQFVASATDIMYLYVQVCALAFHSNWPVGGVKC